MGKIDELKELSATKRESLRAAFLFLLAFLSGSGTVLIAVLSKSMPSYMVWVGALGVVASLFVSILIVKYLRELDSLAQEIKDV